MRFQNVGTSGATVFENLTLLKRIIIGEPLIGECRR